MKHSRLRRVHAALIALSLAGAVAALIRMDPGGRAEARPSAGAPASPRSALGTTTPRAKAPAKHRVNNLYSPVESGGHTTTGYSVSSKAKFRDLFPAQYRATIDPSIPATNYWALLIGINDYAGSTRDNIGSYQDARDLRTHLRHLGWYSDHIVVLTDRHATASMIIQAIRWLASKTDSSSTAVFNYSGHEEPKHYGGTRHIMLWAADNRLIPDTTVAGELGRVDAAKMWINLAVCRAGGFNDPGLVKTNRVVTFSSPESELSYEDPNVHHSVFGWYEIMEGMVSGQGDANNDGNVTVEEAYSYARPNVVNRTHGAQHPFIIDKLSGQLSLIPPRPAPPPPDSQPTSGGCTSIFCGGSAAAIRED
jgi:Caspase domain